MYLGVPALSKEWRSCGTAPAHTIHPIPSHPPVTSNLVPSGHHTIPYHTIPYHTIPCHLVRKGATACHGRATLRLGGAPLSHVRWSMPISRSKSRSPTLVSPGQLTIGVAAGNADKWRIYMRLEKSGGGRAEYVWVSEPLALLPATVAAAHYATPLHIKKHHATPRRHTTPHHTTPHHATPRHATPHHATPCHTTPRHTTRRHTTPHHTTSHHTTPHHTTPHHTTPRHTTPRHTTSHHATPCHTTPHHTTPRHTTPQHAHVHSS